MKNYLNSVILVATMVFASCKEEPSMSFVEGNNLQVLYGDTIALTIKYTPDDAYLDKVSWKSSNYIMSRLAMADRNATQQHFAAKGVGEVNISAEANIDGEHFTTTCQITVYEITMNSLQIDSTEYELKIGDNIVLNAIYEPFNTSFTQLKWSSSNRNVATINNKGELKAVGLGESTITVSNERSGLKANCHITVLPIEMNSLVLNETECNIEIGGKIELVASYEPKNTTFTDLYWHSSNEDVATVSNGIVEAIGTGECIISVTNSDNSLTAQCNVNVFITEITNILCTENITTVLEDKFTLSAILEPSNATTYNNALRWHSSDESIAKVNEFTGEVNCVGIGECIITISNIYNSVTATCYVKVLPISVKNISLKNTFQYFNQGSSRQFEYEITPNNASNKNVKWTSSNTSVAIVTDNGLITAVGEGTATITVSALDGSGCNAKYNIEVMNYVDYMDFYVKRYIIVNKPSIRSFTVHNIGPDIIYLMTSWDNKKYVLDSYAEYFETTTSNPIFFFGLNGSAYLGYDANNLVRD